VGKITDFYPEAKNKDISGRHIPALDGVRGLAVLTVFVYHYGGGAQSSNPILRTLGSCNHAGWCGVTLFFLLSGFLISGILWDSKGKSGWWRRFYWRRCLRIFPLYYAALTIVLVSGVLAGDWRVTLPRLGIFAIYLQDLPQLQSSLANIGSPLHLGHFWSLAVEEQFYLLWPFLLVRARRLSEARNLCVLIFLLSAIYRIAVWLAHSNVFSGSLPARAGELAAGAFLAMSFRDPPIWRRIARFAPTLMVTGGLSFLFAAAFDHSFASTTPAMTLFGLPCITLALSAFLVLSLEQGLVARLSSQSWLRWLGGISYGIYVFHEMLRPVFQKIVIAAIPHATRSENLCAVFVVAAVFTLLIAQLSFRFFERPILKLKERNPKKPGTSRLAAGSQLP